ncbi:hypothetical protein ACOMHN_001093 [Nucella lapillus]
MLSRFERGQRLPVAARLPALLWIVFFYSLNIPKMVDFRGFKHPDVPEGGRGGVNKHRGVQKSKKIFIALRAGPAAARGCPWLPVYRPCCGSFFFYSLNIPKKVDFRGFKHSDVPEGARGGVNKHREVQKSKKNVIALRAGPAAACGCPWLPVYRPCCGSFFSMGIFSVDFRGFKHSDVPEGARGGVNKHRGVQKSTHRGWGPKNMKISTASTYPKRSIFGVLSTQTCPRGPGESKKAKKMLSRFERGQRLPVAARLLALLWIVFFYSLNIPKMVDFRGFKHPDVPEGGRGALRRAGGGQGRSEQVSWSPKKQKKFYRASSGASGCPRLPVAARLPALLWIVFFYSLNKPKMVDFRGFEPSDVEERGRGDVPPQSNSPPDTVFRADRSRRRGRELNSRS